MSKTIFWQVLTCGFWRSQHRQRRRAHHRLLQYDGHNGCQSHRRRTSVRAPTTRHLHRPRQENHRPLNGPAATLRILRIALLSIINLFEGRAMCRYGVYGVYAQYITKIFCKNICVIRWKIVPLQTDYVQNNLLAGSGVWLLAEPATASAAIN